MKFCKKCGQSNLYHMKSPELGSLEQYKNEEIALKMQVVLDKVKQPQNHETLSSAGYNFANEKYDAGQIILEKNGFWHDAVREVAVEANQAEREKNGGTPLSFAEAKDTINRYAKLMSESGGKKWEKEALLIKSVVSGADRPGVEGVNKALEYIEGVLRMKTIISQPSSEIKKEWEEQRAVRDALFAEKQRRIESSIDKNKRVPESRLSKEEIVELNKKDKVDLAGLKEILDLNEKEPEKIPTDERGLVKYHKDNFGRIEGHSLENFKKEFTPEMEDKYRAYIIQFLKNQIKNQPTQGRYADTVAGVLGNAVPFLQRILALKEGRVIDMEKVLKMPFSKIAKEYLNVSLPEDYFNHYSPR